ncbi:hypothetical protein B0H10DRAFT_1964753 [Mycena sp. CBHHK59/15]|nr:hypothetical protein B0H10DRAFT_1964753 [Mycena sp. CBHHK59/15]
MHLCLKQEIDSRELDNDMDTVTWVVAAVWHQFVELKEHFQHQQVADLKQMFEWLSSGLFQFKNYWDWNDSTNPKYFMDSDMTAWSSVDTVRELEPSELTKILAYHDGPDSEDESSVGSSPEETETAPSSSGTWHGHHWTETRKPFMAMLSLNIQCGEKLIEEDNQTRLSGNGTSFNGLPWTMYGSMNSANQPEGNIAFNFERYYEDGTWIRYTGTFFYDRDILSGTFERFNASGSFLFKKVPTQSLMCLRPFTPVLGARELWVYAYNAVVDSIRRQQMRPSYSVAAVRSGSGSHQNFLNPELDFGFGSGNILNFEPDLRFG